MMIKGWLVVYQAQCLIQMLWLQEIRSLLNEGSCLSSYCKANNAEAESRQVDKCVSGVLLS